MGNNAICNCNHKQEQPETDLTDQKHNLLDQTNTHGVTMNTNFNTQTDQRKFVSPSNAKSGVSPNKLFEEQKNKLSLQQFKALIKIQSVIRGYLIKKRLFRKEKEKINFNSKTDFRNASILANSTKDLDYDKQNENKNLKLANTNANESFGIQVWKDGAVYKGQFVKIKDEVYTTKLTRKNSCSLNYKAHGKGIFTHVEGDIYKGEFENDETNGYGLYIHLNGAKYEGYWKEDNQCGYGIEEWVDGSTFEGEYDKGMKEGIGTYNWADGSSYLGEWKRNNLDGYGIYKFSDGRIYLGQWVENSMHGFGEFLWDDGKKYVGYYIDDKKEGFGMYMWNNPLRIYLGFWKNGKQHGIGKYITKNYSKWGVWEGGTRKTWFKKKEEAVNELKKNISEYKFLSIMIMEEEEVAKLLVGGMM